MHTTRRQHLMMLGSATALTGFGATREANAESHAEPKVIDVQMLNANPDDSREKMVFYPDLIEANPGDTIRFLPTDRGHNVAADDDMLPQGVEPFKSRINEEFEITVEAEGTYGIHCTPHRTAGMVGLILVGDASANFEEARDARQRGRARQRYEEIFARAEELIG